MQKFDTVIIGGGPTGINCAIAATRAGLDYVVLEKGMLVHSIYNFPTYMTFFSTSRLLEIGDVPFISHLDKPTRLEALEYYRRLVDHYQLRIRTYEEVSGIEPQKDGSYQVVSTRGAYPTRSVIIATGFYDTPRLLGVPGEDLPNVSHYYNDPHPYVGQKLLVVGAANSACDAALECWSKGAEVTMAIRSDEIYKRVKYWIRPNIVNRIKEGSIKAHFRTVVKEIREKEIILEGPDGEWSLPNDFVLAMTGYTPNFPMLEKFGLTIKEVEGNLQPDHREDSLETNLPNVFLAGVVCAGMQTSKLFIENTRDHAERIISGIRERLKKEMAGETVGSHRPSQRV